MPVKPQFEFDHEEHGAVVVQDLTAWDGESTDSLDAVEAEWMSIAERAHITGAVTVFDPDMGLGKETQEHLAGEWTENADRVGIGRIALVSEGIKARAVSANLDGDQTVRTFSSKAEAVEWAGE